MATNLECRMYEARYPEVDTVVMIRVKSIEQDVGVYVSLLEYNDINGMILLSELSQRRIRSVLSLVKVGRIEPAMVTKVNKEKGYIDLSKRRLSKFDISECVDRFDKSKLVHSIMRHVAESIDIDLEALYERIGWPLYEKYGHAIEAFKRVRTDPDSVLDQLTYEVKEIGSDGQEVTKVLPAVTPEIKAALVKDINRRMPQQSLKIRADIVMTCNEFDGVLHIKEAMRKAQAAGTDNCRVKIQIIAAPLYILTTHTLDKDQGILVLTKAINACREEIEHHKGKLAVKNAPRATDADDTELVVEEEDEEKDTDDEEEEEEEEDDEE